MINIKKSIEIALATKGGRKIDLAVHLGIDPSSLSRMMQKNNCTIGVVSSSSEFFGMTTKDFIALGENSVN